MTENTTSGLAEPYQSIVILASLLALVWFYRIFRWFWRASRAVHRGETASRDVQEKEATAGKVASWPVRDLRVSWSRSRSALG